MKEKRTKDLAEFVKSEFEKRRRQRLKYELQWRLNVNFFLGNQYCDILPEAEKIIEQDKAFSWQERQVYNHIAPIVESRLAKLNKLVPRVIVRPATGDQEDISSAEVSGKILNSAFERNGIKAILSEGNMWSELCGTVFYKQDWINSAGMFLGQNSFGKNVFEGDVNSLVCPPYEIYPDNDGAQSIERCGSVIHARVYSCKYIENLFGKEVKGEKVETLFDSFNQGINTAEPEERALLMEYYENPTEEFVNGRYIAVCGDTLLYSGELPYINGNSGQRKIPFAQQNCITRPGCIWGISIVERCIPVQRAYNAVRNRKHEFLARAAVGILTCEEGAVDLDDLEENGLAPGKVICYRQGSNPPTIMAPGNIPDEFTREEQELLEEFNLISGTSDLMRQSVAPANVTSGTALNIIAEQDDTRIAITADRVRDCLLEISRQWLRLFKQFASSTRIERIVGKNGSVDKFCWQNNMLTSDDVIHETENELSDSVASRKQMVFDLLARGLFTENDGTMPQSTKGKILHALGMGDWENITDMSEVNSQRAKRENLLLSGGKSIEVLDADDHEMHIVEHSKLLLSQEFEEQFGMESQQRTLLEEHILIHKQKKEEQFDGERE